MNCTIYIFNIPAKHPKDKLSEHFHVEVKSMGSIFTFRAEKVRALYRWNTKHGRKMPQHVAAPTIPPMIHCSTVFTQELPQFPSPTVLTLPPCQPLPPGEIIPSPVACSLPHWCWFTRTVVAALQSIFNILFNGCSRGCVPDL